MALLATDLGENGLTPITAELNVVSDRLNVGSVITE